MRIVKNIESSLEPMPEFPKKIKQFQRESDAWKKILEFMLRENAQLKNRLAALVSSNKGSDKDFLEEAEQYQSLFIREDESINLLRRDLSAQDKWLQREIHGDGVIQGVLFRQNKLRKDIRKALIEFNKIKKQFDHYEKGVRANRA